MLLFFLTSPCAAVSHALGNKESCLTHTNVSFTISHFYHSHLANLAVAAGRHLQTTQTTQ